MTFIFCGIAFACTANAEEVYWFSDGTLANRSSCEPGGDITTPNGPYKYGYRFIEWAPMTVYDITTLDTTENSTNYVTANNQWRVKFSYGTVLGLSLCQSVTQAQFIAGATLNPDQPSGVNCYCRVIGFIPDGETNIYAPSYSAWGWARTGYYDYTAGNDNCKNRCLPNCASYVGSTATLRAALYGASGN